MSTRYRAPSKDCLGAVLWNSPPCTGRSDLRAQGFTSEPEFAVIMVIGGSSVTQQPCARRTSAGGDMAQRAFPRGDDLATPGRRGEVVPRAWPAPAEWDLPTIEVVGVAGEHGVALAAYVQLVGAHLHHRGIGVGNVSVFAPTPHRALSASMVLRSPSRQACRAGWHEELGWWIGGATTDTNLTLSTPCWLGVLLPAAYRAAELLDVAATSGIDPAVPARTLRYRFADEPSLLAELQRALR